MAVKKQVASRSIDGEVSFGIALSAGEDELTVLVSV
jgi:hypothetical protein